MLLQWRVKNVLPLKSVVVALERHEITRRKRTPVINIMKFIDYYIFGKYRLESIEMLPLGTTLDNAIELLEMELDSDMITLSIGLDGGPAFPHIIKYIDDSDAVNRIMKTVVKYRMEHPGDGDDPIIKSVIDHYLNK